MAVTHWYTGRATETTATVVVRADSTGNVPVVANGQTLQAACNTATNDGNAVVEFTGLTPGVRYPYTVGGVAGGELRPFPTQAPFWLAISSCWDIARADTLAHLLLAGARGADPLLQEVSDKLAAFVSLGDWFYCDRTDTVHGVALSRIDGGTLANAKSLTVRRDYHRASGLTRGRMELQRSVPTYLVKDDHEYDPDNASYSVDWLDDQFAASAPHTAQDLTDVWTAAATPWREWTQGNPAREVASGILDGPDCYRVRIGPLEIWCTDLIHERDYTGTVDGPTKRVMSALQEEWLLSTMAASTAQFKLWASSKQFISSCGRNSDGFTDLGGTGRGYRNQLTRILTDARFPRSACLSVTGDEHLRSDMMVSAGQFGGSHAAISQISAGPATIEVITNPNDGLTYRAGVRDKERDVSTAARRGENNYVLLRVLADRVERYVLGSRYGLRYMGYVGTQDNLVRR